MDIFKRKKELRTAMSLILKKLDQSNVQKQSEAVFKKLSSLPAYVAARNVSVYVSMPGEVSTESIILDLLGRGVSTFVPQFRKGSKEMAMVRLNSVDDYQSLPEFMWGIRQPPFGEDRMNAMESGLDLILLPGVAFTLQGQRLGHGGSYYDTFLTNYSHKFGKMPNLVALALKEQIVDDVPITEHDWNVHTVVHG